MDMWNGFRANMFNNLFCNKVPVCRQSFREGEPLFVRAEASYTTLSFVDSACSLSTTRWGK